MATVKRDEERDRQVLRGEEEIFVALVAAGWTEQQARRDARISVGKWKPDVVGGLPRRLIVEPER